MKLSMWIFADWLKDYQPELHIRGGKLEIETVRLFSSQSSSDDDNCLYIGRIRDLFIHGNNNVLCTHKNDIILLPTNDLDEIMNQILNAFEHYQRWNVQTLEAISSDRRPSDLLSIAQEVLHEPVYLLDSNQYALALSEGYGYGSVNRLWDQMLTSGSADLPFLRHLDREYPEHRTNRGLYYFNAPFIEEHSYNYNMFLENTWIGVCSMIEHGHPLPQHTIDLFHIFCQNLELWYISHSREQRSMQIDAQFREALIADDGVSDAFVRQCGIRFHADDAKKHLLVLKGPADQTLLMSHICRELSLTFPDIIAILYQDYICVLAVPDSDDPDNSFSRLLPLLKNNGYYGGISSAFEDLKRIHGCFLEASYALSQNPGTPGTLTDYRKCALNRILSEIGTHTEVDLIHPDITALSDYDRCHHTEFAHTLRVWLEQERSQSRTAAALNIHRNSLTYRLQRLSQLLSCDPEDPDTRLHLLLSFKLLS